MDLAELVVRLAVKGADAVKSALKETKAALADAGEGARKSTEALSLMEIPLLRVAAAAGIAAAAFGGMAVGLMSFSGVKLAAEFQRIEFGFKNMLHSASAAHELMASLKDMGSSTMFNTEQLVEFSRILLNTGSNAKEVVTQMRAIADAGAAAGMDDSGVREITRMMGDLRTRAHVRVEEMSALGARIPLTQIVNAGSGKNFSNTAQSSQYLASIGGEKAFAVLTKGMERAFAGAANASTFLGIIENLGEAFRNIMLPTGELLLPALGAAGIAIKTVAGWIGRLNELTGGGAGLAVMILGLYRAKNLLIGSVIMAAQKIRELTASIAELAVTSKAASAATSGAGGGGGGAASAAGGLAGGLKGLFSGGLKGLGSSLLGGLKGMGAGGIAAIADIGMNMLGDKVGGTGGGILKGMGTGAGMGAMIGSLIPGIGTAIGAAVGAGIGGVTAWFQSRGQHEGGSAVADNTKKAADLLGEIHGHMIGGGERGRRFMSQTETEIGIARALGAGIG